MKKILLFVLLCVCGFAYGQTPSGYTKINARYKWTAGIMDSGFHVPQYNGVPSGTRTGVWAGDGAIAVDTLNHYFYIFSGGAWVKIAKFSDISTPTLQQVTDAGTTTSNLMEYTVNLNGSMSNFSIPNKVYVDSSVLVKDLSGQKNDTITLVSFNTDSTSSSNGWTKKSLWTANTTETIVSDGLEIANDYSGTINGNNTITLNTWESCINHKTAVMDIKITLIGATRPSVGLYLWGATNLFSVARLGEVNLSSGAVSVWTYSGQHSIGTLSNAISTGDSIRLYFTENFDYYTVRILNFSDGTDESFSFNENGGSGTSTVTDCYPGIFVQNATVILKKYNYYGHNYQPDLMVLGSSISQNQKLTHGYDSSFAGVLQGISNINIEMGGKSANELEDMVESLPEIIKMKPKMVMIEGGYNNNQTRGQSPTVWGIVYRALVDSLLNHGIRVIVERIIPANNTTPVTVNTWVDSTYTNHPKVQIINLYNTTLIYNTGSANNADLTYFADAGVHPNMAGGNQMAQYVKTQLEKMRRYNVSGGTDVDTPYFRNNVILIGDSAAYKQLQFKWRKLGNGFSINTGDSTLNTPWTISGNDIYKNNSGSVGIGTSTPAKIFHTVGTVRHASLGTASSDTTTYKPMGIDASGDVFPMTYWPGGGSGGTPAGNFGNIQLNRNSAFATPASDSLDWESATGLGIKGDASLTGGVTIGNATAASTGKFMASSSTPGLWFGDNTTSPSTGNFQMLYDNSQKGLYLNAPSTGYIHIRIANDYNNALLWSANSRLGVGFAYNGNPTAMVHIKAGTATASTAPLKFTSGTNLTTAEAGAMEYDGKDLFFTPTGTIRKVIPTIISTRSTGQTAAVGTVATQTVGASDASFIVSANVLVTTSSAEAFTTTVAYTDEGNTARTLTLNYSLLAGTIGVNIAFANGAVPYQGVPVQIRCKASTTITIATTGTFTGCVYNVEGTIQKIQ